MKRRIKCIICLILVCFSLFGCARSEEKDLTVQSENLPVVRYESGDYTGEALIDSMQVSSHQDGYSVTICFAQANGMPLDQLPCYQLSELKDPYRLVLSGNFVADNLTRRLETLGTLSGFASSNAGLTEIYLQPGSDAFFSVSEAGSELTLTLSAVSGQSFDGIYLTMAHDASAAVTAAAQALGMAPAAVDGTVVFLSCDPFDTQEEAQSAAQRYADAYANLGLEPAVRSLSAADFSASGMDLEQQRQIAQYQPKIPEDDAHVYVEPWVYGASYLGPYDGDHALFARSDDSNTGSLWLYGYDGEGEALQNAQAPGKIVRAMVCGESRYVAYIDENGGAYWYDAVAQQTRKIPLAEETSALELAYAQDDKLYLLCQNVFGSVLFVYDPASEQAAQTVSLPSLSVRKLQSGGGLILIEDGDGRLYLLSQGTFEQTPYLASDFLISQDGSCLLCVAPEGDRLLLYALDGQSPEPVTMDSAQEIRFAAYAPDGDYLHYYRTDEEGSTLCSCRLSDRTIVSRLGFEVENLFALPAGWAGCVVWTENDTPITYRIHHLQ